MWSYPAAINDGGHASFYYNSQGEFAHETVQALHDIGASDFAQVLSKANDLFPGQQVSRDFDERYEMFMALPDSAHKIMEQLDEKFYTLDDGDELISRLLKYWNGCQT